MLIVVGVDGLVVIVVGVDGLVVIVVVGAEGLVAVAEEVVEGKCPIMFQNDPRLLL
jgi:hypothetical protein